MKYTKFNYIYPQIAKKTTSANYLNNFDNGEYLLQPNYEGQHCVVFTNGFELMVYDHRGKILKDVSNSIDFRKLSPTRNWFVYFGLYCSKYKNVTLKFEQDRFIITDVVVWDGEYLVGSTLLERLALLDHAYKFHATMIGDLFAENFKYLYCTEIIGIFRAKVYQLNFKDLFDRISLAKYNGIVLRKKESALQGSMQSRNNRQDNILCQKKTNFFKF